MISETATEHFWSRVDKSGDCWEWTASRSEGYGDLSVNGKVLKAHRVSYELLVGPIPKGMQIDHKCYNRACVNPAHLQVVDQRRNRENLNGPYSNSKSGVRGVYLFRGRWKVTAKSNGKLHYGGMYDDLKEAEAAAIALRNKVFTNNLADRK